MIRTHISTLLIVALLLGSGCTGQQHKAAAPYPSLEILRDPWGIPHVFGSTDADAMYGLGYATAQDRAFQMYYHLRIMQGRLAETVGNIRSNKSTALLSDIKMRTIGYWRYAQRAANALDPEAKALLEAYSAGVNDYIRKHPDELLYLFDKFDLEPESWTPAACIASWWRVALFFAGDGLGDMGSYYAIKDGTREVLTFAPDDAEGATAGLPIRDDAAVVQREDVTESWVQSLYDYALDHGVMRKVDRPVTDGPAGPRFSHAWVVGGTKTTTGAAVLVSDPQTPVRNPSLFYEYHIQGASFNARGIGVPGSPILLIGFTENVAWGLTALGADQADLFVLQMDPNQANHYLYDGESRPMRVYQESILVKGGEPQRLTVKETHIGPVVTRVAKNLRNREQVVLKRVPLTGHPHSFVAGLGMMRAQDAAGFKTALGQWAFPSANCVFGDSAGHIGYKTILAQPVRSPHALFHGRAAHDGWLSTLDWQEMLPHELLPQVLDPQQGWLVTANHRPIASFYPFYQGNSTGSLGDTDRSWRLKERVLAQDSFKPEDVLAIHYDQVSPIKRDIVRFGLFLRDQQAHPLQRDTLLALKHLEPWLAAGAESDLRIKGTALVNAMSIMFRANFAASTIYGGGGSGLVNMMQTINQRLAEEPHAVLSSYEVEFVDLTLQQAWRNAQSQYGRDPNTWLDQANAKLKRSQLPYFATLDGFGSLDTEKDISMPGLRCIEGGTILSQKAQAYTQYVPLDNPDQAQTILPPGQSEHPDSPSHLCTYKLWENAQLHPAPLSRQAVERLKVTSAYP